MKTKLKSILAVALCAVGFAAFAEEVCPDCGGLNYKVDITDPTCTSVGYRSYSCNDCGNTWSKTLPMTEHAWSDGTCGNCGAKCTHDGKIFGTCEICGKKLAPPPPEISAVSAEGWLDLTVGDRVAKDEETLVVDPAWGEAATATVELQNGWTRTYTCASNDLWDTTALTPGRHGLALRAGEGETGVLYGAFFWKTGDDWVVLDLPPCSTEGIEFQADKTYLALGQYEFAPDKTLSVLDGAKFEYAPGAGFKGGKLEMTKRYGTNVVEGGLYQIVERIKGSEDNPWEIGEGVEAYTNGTDNLVIVGAGTIADLSEIPAGIKSVEITEATVKGAEENAFAGFNNVKVSLPDNWQGELPEKGVWYGATGVTLTRMPMAVRNVKVQQRYPWNGKVDVDFDLTGEGNVKVTLSARVDGKKIKNPTVEGETTFNLGKGGELKDCRITWDAAADFGDAELHQKIRVKLTVEKGESD